MQYNCSGICSLDSCCSELSHSKVIGGIRTHYGKSGREFGPVKISNFTITSIRRLGGH